MEKSAEKEIKEVARRIVLSICESFKERTGPETFLISENEAGEIVIYVRVDNGDLGKAEMIFYPQSFIEPAIRSANDYLERLTSEPKNHEIARFYHTEGLHNLAGVFIDNLQWEAETFVLEYAARSVLSVCTGMKEIPPYGRLRESTMKTLEDLANERKSRVALYADKIEKNYAAPPILFCHIYEAEKKRWMEVRSSYKKVESFKNPLKILKDEYPDLPEDLLARFGDNDRYTKEPATLALLSTARIAHLPESTSAVRTLQKHLKTSRDLQGTTSEEELLEEMSRFRQNEKYMRKIYERVGLHSEQEDKTKFEIQKQKLEIRERKLEMIEKDLLFWCRENKKSVQ